MTAPSRPTVVAREMGYRCWETSCDGDDEWPHAQDEDEARRDTDECCAVTLLDAPCWTAHCASCGTEMEHGEFGRIHWRTERDALIGDDWAWGCPRGCDATPEPSGEAR